MKISTLIIDTGDSYDLLDLFTLAEKADAFGYKRFWLTEHWDSRGLWSNPEPLMPVILGITENIQVGCAGIVLRLHSTLRVASAFRLMNAMYPTRVDLGLAGGFTTEEACKLLIGKSTAEIQEVDFYTHVEELCHLYNRESTNIENNIFVNPMFFDKPNLWLLSFGFGRTEEAIKYGLNYSKSMFHNYSDNTTTAVEEMKVFKQQFFDKHDRLPEVNVAFSGIITDSDNEAKVLREEEKKNPTRLFYYPNIIGTANYFEDKINEFAEFFGVDDFSFLDMTPSMSKRIENIEEISEKMGLTVIPNQ